MNLSLDWRYRLGQKDYNKGVVLKKLGQKKVGKEISIGKLF